MTEESLERALKGVDGALFQARSESISFAAPQPGVEELRSFFNADAGRLESAKREFSEFLETLETEVLQLALVKTGEEGTPMVMTRMGWGGDTYNLLSSDISPETLKKHRHTVLQTIRLKQLRLKMLTTTVAVAIKLSALASTPAGAVLALPVAYQYLRAMSENVSEQIQWSHHG